MKCEHCGYEAPERAVICPECGEILPRPKKPAAEEQAKKEPSPAAEKFSMPFLSAPADLTASLPKIRRNSGGQHRKRSSAAPEGLSPPLWRLC